LLKTILNLSGISKANCRIPFCSAKGRNNWVLRHSCDHV